jgi:hypothetical protein
VAAPKILQTENSPCPPASRFILCDLTDCVVQPFSLEQLRKISKSHRKKVVRRRLTFFVQSWLCTQVHWNPELVKIFGAEARYRWATVGSSNDDAPPDNSALHTGKINSFSLHISRVVHLLLRQRRGAAATTWTSRSSTCKK